MNRSWKILLLGVLAGAALLSYPATAAAQRYYRPLVSRPTNYRPPFIIDTRWENNPYTYYLIHHHWPYPYPPPNPWPPSPYPPNPYPTPYPYYVPYPVPMPVPNGDGSATIVHNFYQLPGTSDTPGIKLPSTAVLPKPQGNQAVVCVKLPDADAEVWFDGKKTDSTGATRVFETPDLTPGKDYHYTIKAVWLENAQFVPHERTVTVTAGQVTTMDFTVPAPKPGAAAPAQSTTGGSGRWPVDALASVPSQGPSPIPFRRGFEPGGSG
jgi:uncharacterized protein (TIGR03000 family)